MELGLHFVLVLPLVYRSRASLTKQLALAGFGSLLVVALITGLTGMIQAMQMGNELERYGALDAMGAIIGMTFCREMGPLWAAIIILARVGSSMAAELGTMVVNEEVEALRVMSIDPVRFLVLPRILALLISMPLLTTIGNVIGLAGGALVSQTLFGLPYDDYWSSASEALTSFEYVSGLFKSVVFALVIGVIACDRGLNAGGGAEGVGKATTSSVVLNVVFVLLTDFIMNGLLKIAKSEGWL